MNHVVANLVDFAANLFYGSHPQLDRLADDLLENA